MSNTVQQALAPIIKEARDRDLWLYSSYQDCWFSPDELERLNAEGRFLWGPVNWRLRDPKQRLAELRAKAKVAKDEADMFAEKIGAV